MLRTYLEDFNATTQQLTTSVMGVMKAINEVEITINEGASGTAIIAEKTAYVATEISSIEAQIEDNRKKSQVLKELVNKFAI